MIIHVDANNKTGIIVTDDNTIINIRAIYTQVNDTMCIEFVTDSDEYALQGAIFPIDDCTKADIVALFNFIGTDALVKL